VFGAVVHNGGAPDAGEARDIFGAAIHDGTPAVRAKERPTT
jgi:hypothetical protein